MRKKGNIFTTASVLIAALFATVNAAAAQDYRLTIDWTQRDLNGRLLMHNVADGKIIQLSKLSFIDNTSRLEDWSLTSIDEHGQNTGKIDELEGLEIKISGDNFTNPDFYKDFPPAQLDLIRWIVQDKVNFDVYGEMYLDSLELNVPFYPDFFQNHRADFEQYVNFNTQRLSFTLLGFSEMKNKNCMLVYFKSLYSPVDADDDTMTLNGRSCFWGHIWVSVDTRTIEHVIMNEDLVYTFKLKANDFERQINMQREVVFSRIEEKQSGE